MKAVLFDLDETLLDRSASLHSFVQWQARGMLRNSVVDANKFCDRFIQLDAHGSVWKDRVYQQLIEEFRISDWTVKELLASYELCFSGFCVPKPGALDAVIKLAGQGLKIGLVSNGVSPFQQRNFNALGISHLFESVLVSAAAGFRKPQKEIFRLACNQLGVSAKQTVFVGDNPVADIEGAAACGMYTVFIPTARFTQCTFANMTCHDFIDLPQIVGNAG